MAERFGASDFTGKGWRGPTTWSRFSAQQNTWMEEARAGWRTAAIVAFIAGLVGLSAWYAQEGAPELSSTVGLAVFAGVAGFLLLLAVGPGLFGGGGALATVATAIGRGFYVYAKPVLWIDLFLRRVVAEACGLRLHGRALRYVLFALHVGLAAAVLWVAPLYWPEYAWAGYVGLGWAFLVAVAVVRQWTWVERQYEGLSTWLAQGEELRLPDLRDQALVAVLLLIVLVPVTLWRLDASFGLFETPDGVAATWLDWAAFFGVELAKAIPVVDWAEVYGARSATVITPVAPLGLYAVFAIRGVIDAALLGGLIFTLARMRQVERQWAEFLAGGRFLVEPALERRVLRMLKAFASRSDGSWFDPAPPVDLGPFTHYNPDRLSALAREDDPKTVAIVAHAAFVQSPAKAFLPIARDILEDDRRSRVLSQKVAMLLVDLLGRANDAAARELLERVLTGFEGRSEDVTARVRCRAAVNLTATWRSASESERAAVLENEVVQRLRYGLQRNRDRNAQIRVAIGDQLSVVGGASALDAVADHLEHENSSVVLTNLAGVMQRMIARAPREPLRRASGVARLRAAILQSRGRRMSDADKLAARALVQAADAMDKAVKDARVDAVLGPRMAMVVAEPV